jgi:hypothetical protein
MVRGPAKAEAAGLGFPGCGLRRVAGRAGAARSATWFRLTIWTPLLATLLCAGGNAHLYRGESFVNLVTLQAAAFITWAGPSWPSPPVQRACTSQAGLTAWLPAFPGGHRPGPRGDRPPGVSVAPVAADSYDRPVRPLTRLTGVAAVMGTVHRVGCVWVNESWPRMWPPRRLIVQVEVAA